MKSVKNLVLGSGKHRTRDEGMCAMEAVAWLAGEDHTDAPTCVSPTIAAFMRAWNDGLPDDKTRTELLRPWLKRVIGTTGTKEQEERRGWLAMDWLIREFTPAWLRCAGLMEHAVALESLVAITDRKSVEAANPVISAAYSAADNAVDSAASSAADSAARSAAYSAAYSAADNAVDSAADSAAYRAARDTAYRAAYSAASSAAYSAARRAAYSAAYSAARRAAYSAAYSAARRAAYSVAYSVAYSAAYSAARRAAYSAARRAAYSVAYSVAYSAAYSAASSAARDALAPTVKILQKSAARLLERMIAVSKK